MMQIARQGGGVIGSGSAWANSWLSGAPLEDLSALPDMPAQAAASAVTSELTWPLSERNFEWAVTSGHAGCVGVRRLAQAFERRAAVCGTPAQAAEPCASQRQCGSLCLRRTPQPVLRLYHAVVQGVRSSVAQVERTPSQVCEHDLLFGFEVFDRRDDRLRAGVDVALVAFAIGRGRVARTVCMEAEVAGTARARGTRVTLKREEFVGHRSSLPHPFREQQVGVLRYITEYSLAARLVTPALCESAPAKGVIRRLAYRQEITDTLINTRLDRTLRAVTMLAAAEPREDPNATAAT